jgi:hypothetical protein
LEAILTAKKSNKKKKRKGRKREKGRELGGFPKGKSRAGQVSKLRFPCFVLSSKFLKIFPPGKAKYIPISYTGQRPVCQTALRQGVPMAKIASSIPWHPAFVQALKLELEPYRDALEFIPEYQLTSEPLEIDVVIVKKAPDLVIEKNIARIFRRINVLEYKSPDDYFSVSDFYKVLSYAFLYAALNHTPIEDLTLSIIETRHPRKLFKHIQEAGHGRISETASGIYRLTGYPLEIQVIESKKLPVEENLWLKGLTKDLNPRAAGSILEESRKKGTEAELEAYLYVLINTNQKAIEEVLAMAKKELPFDRLVEEMGLAAKWRAEGEVRGEARGKKTAWKEAIALMKQGYTVEDFERMTPPTLGT